MESPYRLTSDRFRPDLHAEKNPSPPFSFRNRIESPPRSTFSDRSPPNRPAVRRTPARPARNPLRSRPHCPGITASTGNLAPDSRNKGFFTIFAGKTERNESEKNIAPYPSAALRRPGAQNLGQDPHAPRRINRRLPGLVPIALHRK